MISRGGKVICVTSSKGGVGKTFFATNLAGILARLEKRVLVIDLDLATGAVGVNLNVKNKLSVYNLSEDIKNKRYQSFKDYIVKYNNFIDVIIAPVDPREARKTDAAYISNAINYAKSKYDAIIIDTTHVFDDVNILAIEKSDAIIEVLTNDPANLKNTANTIKLFKESKVDNYFVLLNEADAHDKNYYTIFDIKNIIGAHVDYIISRNLHLKNIDKLIVEGIIPSLSNRTYNKHKKEWRKLEKMLTRILEQKKVGIK